MMEQIDNKNTVITLKEETKKNKRVIYFDILNILACLSVVFLHMNGIVHSYTEARAWKTALIFEVICFWAVPVFVMLSGATLFKYRERYNTKEFFKKRFIKVLIPWIIWSLITFIINTRSINIIKFIEYFLYCKIENIYWFFPLILYLYCLIPIFSVLAEKQEYRGMLKAIVIFIFIFAGVINPICIIFNVGLPTIFVYCLSHSSYIMFLILGYLLSTSDLSKKDRIIIYVLGILSAVIRYWYTYFYSTKEGVLNRDLFDYCSAVSVLLAVAVFVLIKNINWDSILKKLHISNNVIAQISSYSFGVYLIHMLVKSQLTNTFKLDIYSIWYRTIGSILLYLICVCIVYIIKKIPIVKKIVP